MRIPPHGGVHEVAAVHEQAGSTVTKQFFSLGVKQGSANYFYTNDHLGSVREPTDVTNAVVARYEYDPWGRQIKISGTVDSDFGFTGHYQHVPTSLTMASYRICDASLGRWISEDPYGLTASINLAVYASQNPANVIDPFGLGDYSSNPTSDGKPPTPNGLTPWIAQIETTVDIAFNNFAQRDAVVTATTNGEHNPGTLHSLGRAIDLRTRDLSVETVNEIVRQIRRDLPSNQYDVVHEKDHLHIEFDPKPPEFPLPACKAR